MRRGFIACLPVLAALLLSSCGGDRGAPLAMEPALSPPDAARVSAELCARVADSSAGLVVHRLVDGDCLRSFAGMNLKAASLAAVTPDRRMRTLAVQPTAALTITELFDWAERAYPEYFPSHQTSRLFATYTYRYYPESDNHVAVSGGKVYVQGPISDGALLYLGTLEDFNCRVFPQRCGTQTPKACAAVASWVVGFNACTPNAGQPTEVPSGSDYTFVDSTGSTHGQITYSCKDGVLTQKGNSSCEVPAPLACNTANLTWKAGANTCTANADEPTQLASGATHTYQSSTTMLGNVTYACNNGELILGSVPTCNPPLPVPCVPKDIFWQVGEFLCLPDVMPVQVSDGANYTFTDVLGEFTGSVTYSCKAGVFKPIGSPVCLAQPHIQDSFGGDGGAADGGTNGDGTAGDGAPIVGGAVRVVDTTGKVATATTNSQGYYRVKLTGMVPPLVISVTRPDGVVRRSVSTQALRTNGYIFMAVTGLTDKIASDVARASGFPGAASLTPAMVAARPQAVTEAVTALRNDATVSAALVAAGVSVSTFDPLNTPFRANSTGYDLALDTLVVTTDASGATIVKSVDCPAPTSWTVGNLTCTPDAGQPTVIRSESTVIYRDSVLPNTGTVGFTCLKSVIQAPVLPSCKG